MTASNSKSTNADKNLNKVTTAETRRASKPLMEKRRRARINSSLSILKTLVVDNCRDNKGQKNSKLEKADILEMSVAYLQSVKKSDEQKFMEGFEECCSETIQFLEKSKINSSIVDKLTDHLKHFQQNVDHASLLKQNQTRSSTSPTLGTTSIEEESGPLRPFSISVTVSEQGDSNSCPFALTVPRFQSDNSKAVDSSHSSCLSPSLSMSNDSNNNSFINEMEACQSISPTFRNGPLRQVEFVAEQNPNKVENLHNAVSQSVVGIDFATQDSQVLNLSTSKSYSYENSKKVSSVYYSLKRDEEPMEDSSEPLDFSKPLNLCKHPVGYRLSEDGVWRPW